MHLCLDDWYSCFIIFIFFLLHTTKTKNAQYHTNGGLLASGNVESDALNIVAILMPPY